MRPAAMIPGGHTGGAIVLGVNGRQHLSLEVRGSFALLDRDQALALLEVLRRTEAADALALMGVFRRGLRPADHQFIVAALEQFEEEIAFEDRRGEPRVHKAVKRLAI